jgi:hypothetical protein
MLLRVALVRTDVSEALCSSETSVLTRATRRTIPEYAILHIEACFQKDGRKLSQVPEAKYIFKQTRTLTEIDVNP